MAMLGRCFGILVFLTGHGLAGSMALAQEAVTSEAVSRAARLDSVKALLVALKRLNQESKGGKDGEIERIERGLGEAGRLIAAGNEAEAGRLIDSIYGQTKSALASMQSPSALKSGTAALAELKQDTPSAAESSQLKSIFARRDASVESLLATGSRIAQEKGVRRDEIQVAQGQQAEARSLAQQGSYKAAIALIDQAYQKAKTVLHGLRDGEQLMAEKHFATPAEEFEYEQTRNDDYQNLIEPLLNHSSEAAWTEIARSGRALRSDSELAARSGQWDRALKDIGRSTQEYKGILRRAGFPIM